MVAPSKGSLEDIRVVRQQKVTHFISLLMLHHKLAENQVIENNINSLSHFYTWQLMGITVIRALCLLMLLGKNPSLPSF